MSNKPLVASILSLVFCACVPGTYGGSVAYVARPQPQPAQPQPAAAQPAPVAAVAAPPPPAAAPAHSFTDAEIDQATKPIATALRDLGWIEYNEKQNGLANASAGNSDTLVADGKACAAAAASAIARGIPATTVVESDSFSGMKRVPLGDARGKCDELVARGGSYDARVTGAQAEAEAKIAAPYKRAGIGGDKLKLLVAHDGYGWQGMRGEALDTPNKLATAQVIFELVQNVNDGTWTLRKYVFEGNAQDSETERTFVRKPGAEAFR